MAQVDQLPEDDQASAARVGAGRVLQAHDVSRAILLHHGGHLVGV